MPSLDPCVDCEPAACAEADCADAACADAACDAPDGADAFCDDAGWPDAAPGDALVDGFAVCCFSVVGAAAGCCAVRPSA